LITDYAGLEEFGIDVESGFSVESCNYNNELMTGRLKFDRSVKLYESLSDFYKDLEKVNSHDFTYSYQNMMKFNFGVVEKINKIGVSFDYSNNNHNNNKISFKIKFE
jgi:hypothetical protein